MLRQESGDSYRQSRVLYDLAIGRYSMGGFDEAIDFYRRGVVAHGSCRRPGVRYLERSGDVYTSREKSSQALECFDTALRIAEEAKNRGREAAGLTSAGNIYQRRGEPQKAIRNFRMPLRSIRAIPKPKELRGRSCSYRFRRSGPWTDRRRAHRVSEGLGSLSGYGDAWGIANALWSIGRVDLVRDRHQEALEHLGESPGDRHPGEDHRHPGSDPS